MAKKYFNFDLEDSQYLVVITGRLVDDYGSEQKFVDQAQVCDGKSGVQAIIADRDYSDVDIFGWENNQTVKLNRVQYKELWVRI